MTRDVSVLEPIKKAEKEKEVSYKLDKVHSTPDGLTHCWRIAFNDNEFKDFRIQTENPAVAKYLKGEGFECVANSFNYFMKQYGFNYFMEQYAVHLVMIDHILKIIGLPSRIIDLQKWHPRVSRVYGGRF